MKKAVLLDSHPLSEVTHPKGDPRVKPWLHSLQESGVVIRVPEIVDYELRRELIRGKKQKSIERLDKLSQFLIPLTNETMRQAAELWAEVRNQGKPTASKDSLDIDVILASQATLQLPNFDEVTIITTNVKHISRFEKPRLFVVDWEQTLNSIVS
ncbi:type II toxin-antitoxin system VapC family toxin [Scytonema sp. NUACC26]|uniref:type II toxin-antitoxin system VapC family toxin n=1 Tax=Scytonema sp. NUACC26 TaxID=3140176 RepID=UPI0034DBB77C